MLYVPTPASRYGLIGPGIGRLNRASAMPDRIRPLPPNPTFCLSSVKRLYEKFPCRPNGIIGRLRRTMPDPCQPFLNASLASPTGTLAPPPNPIWNGFTGSCAEATPATSRKGRVRRRARDRMEVPPGAGEVRVERAYVVVSPRRVAKLLRMRKRRQEREL